MTATGTGAGAGEEGQGQEKGARAGCGSPPAAVTVAVAAGAAACCPSVAVCGCSRGEPRGPPPNPGTPRSASPRPVPETCRPGSEDAPASQKRPVCKTLALGTFSIPPHPCVPGPSLLHIRATVTEPGWAPSRRAGLRTGSRLLLRCEMELIVSSRNSWRAAYWGRDAVVWMDVN